MGGLTSEMRNIISGNPHSGVVSSRTGTLVQGNRIGVDVSGNLKRGNGDDGIHVTGGTIGGKLKIIKDDPATATVESDSIEMSRGSVAGDTNAARSLTAAPGRGDAAPAGPLAAA